MVDALGDAERPDDRQSEADDGSDQGPPGNERATLAHDLGDAGDGPRLQVLDPPAGLVEATGERGDLDGERRRGGVDHLLDAVVVRLVALAVDAGAVGGGVDDPDRTDAATVRAGAVVAVATVRHRDSPEADDGGESWLAAAVLAASEQGHCKPPQAMQYVLSYQLVC